MKIKVHVQGIKGSGRRKEGEEAGALFGGLLEIDGMLIDQAIDIQIRAHEGFFEVKPVLLPGSFEVVSHTDESWPELMRQVEDQKVARDMNGLLIGRSPNSR